MLKIHTVLILCAAFILQSFTFKGDQKVRLRDYSWTDIGRSAKSQDKMIFVLITGEYCTSSRKMKRVLNDKKIGEFYNKNFVSTSFDSENLIEYYRASNWGVSSVPAMVFLDKNRKVIHKVEGFKNADAMLKEAQIALSKK